MRKEVKVRERKVGITVALPVWAVNLLEEEAERKGMKVSTLLRMLVLKALEEKLLERI